MNDLAKSVKHIMIIFLFCFVGLISYITYFQVFKAPKIAEEQGNVRLWAKRNEVLRGTIFDRNGNALTSSERVDEISQKRTYLQPEIYVHALGYIDRQFGLTGLEESFDSELTTSNKLTNNIRTVLKDLDVKEFVKALKSEDDEKIGNGLITTLDPVIQEVAYNALGYNKGAVVAINPKTGEILAMVSNPTYNPNNLEEEMSKANEGSGDDSPLINRAINGIYPPGSVFKTVTIASALENIEGITTREFQDNGKIEFADGTTLNNYAFQSHGVIDLRTAYRVSSNVVFGELAMEIGNSALKSTAESFGFNSMISGPGLDITPSSFPSLDQSEKGNIAQSGIGQGSVLSTPMQMALVAAVVANDGVMMQPKLVNKIIDKDGNTIKNIDEKKLKQVISKETASTIQQYMEYLVSNNLYRWPAFEGTNAGGKTGTADYKLPDGTDAVPHGWFISAAPMDDPEIAVAVIVENGESGAGSAAIIASKVVRAAVLGE